MIEIKRIRTNDKVYDNIEELLIKAFPIEERRDIIYQRQYTDHNPIFYCNCIIVNNVYIGSITYWDFTEFIYIEHFATEPLYRNKGYGSQTLQILKEKNKVPIVLEAEEPTDEISRRRIAFYKRQGFKLEEYPYMQPPYRKDDEWIPMKLLTYGLESSEDMLNNIKNRIYKNVYGI